MESESKLDWMSKDHLASDPELRSLQLRWATDDLWMRRLEVAAALLAALAFAAAAVVVILARPESLLLYAASPSVGAFFGALAYTLRRLRRGGAKPQPRQPE